MGAAEASLMTLPFLTLNPYWSSADQYPISHAASVMQTQGNVRTEATSLRFQIAMAQLESGDIQGTIETLREAIQKDPTSSIRPLLNFYLFCTTNEMLDKKAPETAPVEEFESLTEGIASEGAAAEDK